MTSHAPTPDWVVEQLDLIFQYAEDPEVVDALIRLLAALAPSEEQDKFKHEAAWAGIVHGYKKTPDVHDAARRYLGIAV